jgi:hypothetical protein
LTSRSELIRSELMMTAVRCICFFFRKNKIVSDALLITDFSASGTNHTISC